LEGLDASVRVLARADGPECPYAGGGGKTLETTWVREYTRQTCPECGAISVFNPIGRVGADLRRHVFVARDGTKGKGVEHIWPKARVLRV
jgi:hypothetical protein